MVELNDNEDAQGVLPGSEAGVVDEMAIAARAEARGDNMSVRDLYRAYEDSVKAYEALTQRVKDLEDALDQFQRTLESLRRVAARKDHNHD